jgi:hypothetical protein
MGTELVPLCNFTATITAELELDDGAEVTRAFTITGALQTGEPFPEIRVPASRFPALAWVTESWGARAIVGAGRTTQDACREAIQRLSPTPRRRRVFTHTGWRQLEAGQWVYLSATGAVAREDIEVDLGTGDLSRYRLPTAAEDPVGAMRLSLSFLRMAPLAVTGPILAAVYRAVLASVLPVDVTLWLEGITGSLKSTLAAAGLSHYGPFDRLHLPGSWISTVILAGAPGLRPEGRGLRHRRLGPERAGCARAGAQGPEGTSEPR